MSTKKGKGSKKRARVIEEDSGDSAPPTPVGGGSSNIPVSFLSGKQPPSFGSKSAPPPSPSPSMPPPLAATPAPSQPEQPVTDGRKKRMTKKAAGAAASAAPEAYHHPDAGYEGHAKQEMASQQYQYQMQQQQQQQPQHYSTRSRDHAHQTQQQQQHQQQQLQQQQMPPPQPQRSSHYPSSQAPLSQPHQQPQGPPRFERDLKDSFAYEIARMMFVFGDSKQPHEATVDLVERLIRNHLRSVVKHVSDSFLSALIANSSDGKVVKSARQLPLAALAVALKNEPEVLRRFERSRLIQKKVREATAEPEPDLDVGLHRPPIPIAAAYDVVEDLVHPTFEGAALQHQIALKAAPVSYSSMLLSSYASGTPSLSAAAAPSRGLKAPASSSSSSSAASVVPAHLEEHHPQKQPHHHEPVASSASASSSSAEQKQPSPSLQPLRDWEMPPVDPSDEWMSERYPATAIGRPIFSSLADSINDVSDPELEKMRDDIMEKQLRKLKAADIVTKAMAQDEYRTYTECREANFTFSKQTKFYDWLGGSTLGIDFPLETTELLGTLAWYAVGILVQTSLVAKKDMESPMGYAPRNISFHTHLPSELHPLSSQVTAYVEDAIGIGIAVNVLPDSIYPQITYCGSLAPHSAFPSSFAPSDLPYDHPLRSWGASSSASSPFATPFIGPSYPPFSLKGGPSSADDDAKKKKEEEENVIPVWPSPFTDGNLFSATALASKTRISFDMSNSFLTSSYKGLPNQSFLRTNRTPLLPIHVREGLRRLESLGVALFGKVHQGMYPAS